MPSLSATQCNHIRTSGARCGSPALRNRRYCYYHQRTRPVLINIGDNDEPKFFSMPTLEDAHDIQSTLRQVMLHYLNGNFNREKAGLMFYALQIAASNFKLMQAETPKPDQVVNEIPRLSEMPRPEPVPEAVPLNSHTNRMTHFPESPSPLDEYEDDIKRQAREIREDLAPPNAGARQSEDDKQQTSETQQNGGENRYLN